MHFRESRVTLLLFPMQKGDSLMRIRLVGLLAGVACALLCAGAAQAATTVQVLPYNQFVTICNGDTVQLSGTLLAVTSFKALPSGGHVSVVRFQTQHVTGVDLVTGDTYILASTLSGEGVLNPAGGAEGTFLSHFELRSTSGAESYVMGLLAHLTVAPDGTYIVNFVKPTIPC